MNIGENIKRIREEKGITQAELARGVNLTSPAINQYERGTKIPTLITAYFMAEYLGCSVLDFLGKENEQ